MNSLQVEQVKTEERREAQWEQRRKAAAERSRKRRRKKQMQITLIICICLVIVCAFAIAMLLAADKQENVKTANVTAEKNTASPEIEDNAEAAEESRFEKISYYKEENADRYDEYSQLNPQMAAEEVVWRVNANLDKPKYEFDIPVSGYDDPYILVNKYYTVAEGYRPPDLKSFDGQLLREETGNAYSRMREDALAEGLNIRVVSGYRTVEYQAGLYNRYLESDSKENVDRYSARPGHSEHHTGMALDLFGSQDGLRNFVNTPEFPWVRDNCYKYGFIIRYLEETEDITGYESEPWHLRYVGVEVSTDMKEKNINSFEEYHAKYLE